MGSVSHGTTRPQDLIPAFMDELRERDPDAYAQIIVNGNDVPAFVRDEGDSSEWWVGEDASYLLEELFDALGSCAPEGQYFGAHPGDGCDYGFWECEEY